MARLVGYQLVEERAHRISQVLLSRVDQLVRPYVLSRYLDSRDVRITPPLITSAWPVISQMVNIYSQAHARDLWLVRPCKSLGYRLGVTTIAPAWELRDREKYRVTSMRRDLASGLLDRLIQHPDRDLAQMASRIQWRTDSYLSDYERSGGYSSIEAHAKVWAQQVQSLPDMVLPVRHRP
jgi:hypothetical protein